jgi:alpha-methylacyl-CoA racemase
MKPLYGIKIIDLSTLLPGPLATLILAEAGAEVIKIERMGGEDMRRSPPFIDGESILFAVLNRGKRSIELDIKSKEGYNRIIELIKTADVIIDQFRPGVMERLGLDFKKLIKIKPDIIHCSITGYGQNGPKKLVAAHDLNYMAESGLLSLAKEKDGSPAMPSTQIADIAGGSYPAVINILLALREVEKTGKGKFLDISMTDNLFPFMWMALGLTSNKFYSKGGDLQLTGASPRYGIYETFNKGYIALGALEEKFWLRFCKIIDLPVEFIDDNINPNATKEAIINLIKNKKTEEWKEILAKENNICCSIVCSLEDAIKDTQILERELLSAKMILGNKEIFPMPTPLAPIWRPKEFLKHAPKLGEANSSYMEKP